MQNLSRYRSELMGLAILWILFAHSRLDIPEILAPIQLLKTLGYTGVDVFFLLSGFAMAYSLSRQPRKGIFFRKRLMRIVPVFWLVLCAYFALHGMRFEVTVSDVLLAFTGLDFLLYGDLKFWFVPAIGLSYLLAPFFYQQLIQRSKHQLFYVSLLCMLLLLFLSTVFVPHLLIYLIRLPVFLLGMYLGYAFVHRQKTPMLNHGGAQAVLFVIAALALVCMLLYTPVDLRWSMGLWWYPSIFLAYPLCFFVAAALDTYRQAWVYPMRFLRFSGALSLELYLLHVSILYAMEDIPLAVSATLMQVLYLVLAFLLAWLFRRAIEKTMAAYQSIMLKGVRDDV